MSTRAGLPRAMSCDVVRVDAAAADRVPVGASALRVVAPAMVGRAAELDLLASVVSAPPAVAVIEGEAGIGKTRLVTELAAHPDVAGRRIVVGGCRRIGEPFPLGPVIEAVRGLGDDLAAASLSPVAGALRPLLPELARWLPPQPEPLGERAGERHRVFRGLVEVLGSLGAAVLVLEDLHWADEQTSEFLAYLLGDPPPQLAVVLTFRGEEVDPAVRGVTARLPSSLRRAEVVLAPLDAAQTGSLAAAILDTARISAEFAAHLRERTSGVPFAIEEVLALLRERRDLVREGGGWVRKALDELHVPPGIRDSVLERASRLSDGAREVVEAAAVLLEPVPLSLLMSVCRSPESMAGVEEALASGLLVERGDTVGFRHAMAAQAVYEALPGPRRKRLHARAASALKRLDPPPFGQLAHHLKRAGQSEEWAAVAEQAADQAIALGHEDEAARLLEELLRHATLDGAQRQRLALKLGQVSVEIAHLDGVIALLSDVLGDDLPRAVRGELTFWLAGAVERAGGEWASRRRLFREAVDDLDDRPDLYARAMIGLGIPTAPGVPLAEHMECLHEALQILPKADDPLFELFVRGKVAMVFVAVGNAEWRELTEQIVDQTQGLPRRRPEVNAYESIGEMACYTGHYGIADRLLNAARHGAAECESRRLDGEIQSALALLDYLRGSWNGLDDTAAALVDEHAGTPMPRINAQMVTGCLALARGDLGGARTRLREVVDEAEALDWFDALALGLSALARHAIATDELADVAARMDVMLAGLDAKGLWAPVARALPAVVQILIAAGRESEAQALVARAAKELADLDAPLAPAALQFAQGFLGVATQDWAAAAQGFLTAVQLYEALECPYEEAQAREQAGLALFAAGDARAEPTLHPALATYERLGASWDVARCTKAARRIGVRVPAPHRGGRKGYGQQLSPREKDVARLAALGHTNKAIADELFLSPNTVSKHLTGAMRKLGVRTRAAVAARLRDRDSGLG